MGGLDPFVAAPDWGQYIIWYFYLGGIAAGAYAVATMIGLFGEERDRRAARVAEYLAFPLVNACGLLLVVDLGRPERFWHMLIRSETFRPMFKWWSPMSAGSWGLSAFGAFSFVSFVGVLAEDRRLGMGRWHDPARMHARWARWGLPAMVLVAGYALRFAVVGMPGSAAAGRDGGRYDPESRLDGDRPPGPPGVLGLREPRVRPPSRRRARRRRRQPRPGGDPPAEQDRRHQGPPPGRPLRPPGPDRPRGPDPGIREDCRRKFRAIVTGCRSRGR